MNCDMGLSNIFMNFFSLSVHELPAHLGTIKFFVITFTLAYLGVNQVLLLPFKRRIQLKPQRSVEKLTCEEKKRYTWLVWTYNRSLSHWDQVYCQKPHVHDEWDSKNVLMEVCWQFCVHKTFIPKVHLCICYIFGIVFTRSFRVI